MPMNYLLIGDLKIFINNNQELSIFRFKMDLPVTAPGPAKGRTDKIQQP